MLAGPVGQDTTWTAVAVEGGVDYCNEFGSVRVRQNPWRVEFRDAKGALLTNTVHPTDCVGLRNCQPIPFSHVRRASDLARRFAATFSLAPDEKIFGCGESFTRLNKRGQKVLLWPSDAHGVQTDAMYKPVPFFLSSRGYGMFMHTTKRAAASISRLGSGSTINQVRSMRERDGITSTRGLSRLFCWCVMGRRCLTPPSPKARIRLTGISWN